MQEEPPRMGLLLFQESQDSLTPLPSLRPREDMMRSQQSAAHKGGPPYLSLISDF